MGWTPGCFLHEWQRRPVSRFQRGQWLIASLVVMAAALGMDAADASASPVIHDPQVAQSSPVRLPVPPPPPDQAQVTYLRECMGQGAAASKRRAYCQCSYQQLRRRYTLQQYTLLDDWIRRGPPELRRFAVVAWEPEFASCRPLLQSGAPAAAPQNRQPAASK